MNWPALIATYKSDRDGDGVTTANPGGIGEIPGDDLDDSDPTETGVVEDV